MVHHYQFKDVRLLLADRNREVRDSIKVSLRDAGFGAISSTDRVADLETWIAEDSPDLLISEIELIDGDPCALFSRIRHHRIGDNPFLPIIAISGLRDMSTVGRVIDTGADDLLVKPICMEALFDRINALIRSRKPFVVTNDYIGPTRRKAPRRDSRLPLIAVPNALRAKAVGDLDTAAIQAQITAAVAEVNERKMERHADRIAWLVQRIAEEAGTAPSNRQYATHLDQLLDVAQDLSRRMIGTRYDHVSDLARSLIQVTGRLIEAGVHPEGRDLKILTHLAEAVAAAFTDDRETAEIARDISESVSRAATR